MIRRFEKLGSSHHTRAAAGVLPVLKIAMCDQYCKACLQVAVAQRCERLEFEGISETARDMFTDVVQSCKTKLDNFIESPL